MNFFVQKLTNKKNNTLLAVMLVIWTIVSNIHAINHYSFLPLVSLTTITLLIFSIIYRSWTVIYLCILFSLIFIMNPLVHHKLLLSSSSTNAIWCALSTLLIAYLDSSKSALKWMKLGKIDRLSWVLMIFTSISAGITLLIWGHWTNYLGKAIEIMKTIVFLPPLFILTVVLPVAALFNAFVEEFIFRGVFQESLTKTFGNNNAVMIIVLQASLFAAVHFSSGFPNGIAGYLMAFVWGAMLGYLRRRTCGMLAPYIVHVAADLVIFFYLFTQVS